jgi:hypothetical protein
MKSIIERTLFNLKKPVSSISIEYKYVTFPDKKNYNVECEVDQYSDKIYDDICSCIFTTKIYPFFESQHWMKGKINLDKKNKIILLDNVNSFATKYELIYKDITIYPIQNTYGYFSPYNEILLLKRSAIFEQK